jgi:hypothetical protein
MRTPSRSQGNAWCAWALAAILVAAAPAVAEAQMFFGSRAHPDLTVGPLFVRARVAPDVEDVAVDLFFSLVVPPERSATDFEQDLYIVWPGAVRGEPGAAADPALRRDVEALGLESIGEGRVPMFARNLYGTERGAEALPDGASFVVFVRHGGAFGLTAPATWIRIPWTPRLVNRTWLVGLRFTAADAVMAKPAPWFERLFWGQRYRVSLSFNDVRSRAIFPLYFVNRDRVIRLSEDPSQLIVNFAAADRLKIDELVPSSSTRRRSEVVENTEVVSVFLDRSEGLTPQVLTAQFGYFSGVQGWAPVLIPIVFFALGNLAGPLIRDLARRLGRLLAARVHVGRDPARLVRATGVLLDRQQLRRIVPGESTYDDVVRIAGSNAEEHERLETPDRKTLVYRGRQMVPHRRRTFGWFATVDRWDVEHHEVEISLERNVVRDVQARVRRASLPHPESG